MKKLTLLLILCFTFSCATVPITGRKQLILVSNQEILALSNQNYKDVLKDSKLSNNTAEVQRLRRIGDNIVKAVEKYLTSINQLDLLEGYNWEFNLIESKEMNAWAMPGGKVAFYTGILPVCATDDGIAVVMSHEIAHALAQHGNERMSQQMMAQYGGVALDVAMQNQPAHTRNMAMAAFGVGTQVGILLPYSRTQESEADELGLYFMTLAGYNPDEAPKFWERMTKQGGSQPPEMLSTHPSHETRIKELKENIPKVKAFAKNFK